MSDKQESKRERNTRERREQILYAAVECFIEKGFHQTSMRDIASAAQVSLGNLYNHFANKEALIAEIATIEADDFSGFLRDLTTGKSPLEGLERFARRFTAYHAEPENLALSAEITAEVVRNPSIAGGFSRNRKALVDGIVETLQAGVATGQIRSDIDAAGAAELILDMTEGVAFRIAVLNKAQSNRAVGVMIDALRSWLAR
ncbi:MAG: TetR/AcrR family transcriptional regulator [Pseudomonadota bacterium]